ncbi:MAG TPA: isocitrate/isopropylmalate family dehydrogenase [Dehalococcoidia bacterium]|nr:isocitrate/isopropylmalate family dehydrogenase [Dehalococcoidia bacterium]
MTKRVCVIPGDDAAPEAVLPALGVLKAMELDIEYVELPSGEEGQARHGERWAQVCREAIDSCDTTLFGSTSGKTPALGYLRWQKGTYANLRPVKYIAGAKSPLAHPEGIDFVIVRENMEDMYVGVEGELDVLKPLGLVNRLTRRPIPEEGGRFALKVITEENTRRIAEFACRLALRRKAEGKPGRLTVACKYNMLPQSDGLFRRVASEVAKAYPEVEYEDYIVDDFARRIVASPHDLDVVLLPNLYGDILSDEASALVGGLGVAPSACYSDDFAYFEPVHGTAPDIVGKRIINPTATLLSAAMMLEHLGLREEASALERAVAAVYAEGRVLTPDQGGTATSDEFCAAVRQKLG